MKNALKKMYASYIFTSICFIVIGLLLFIKAESTIEIISYVLGGFIIAIGIVSFIRYFKMKDSEKLFRYDIVYGIVSTLAGLLLVLNPHALASIIPLILGIYITINGALKIQSAFMLKSYQNKSWITALVIGILTLIFGILLIFNPFKGAVVITKVIGAILIIYAVLDIISSFIINRNIKENIKLIEK